MSGVELVLAFLASVVMGGAVDHFVRHKELYKTKHKIPAPSPAEAGSATQPRAPR